MAKRTADNDYRVYFYGEVSDNEYISVMYFPVTYYLPSPAGNYKLEVDFSSDFVFESQPYGLFKTTFQYENSVLKTSESRSDKALFAHGDTYLAWNSLALRSSYNLARILLVMPAENALRNLSGYLSVRFTPVAESGTETAGPTISQQDYQSGVSDSLNNIGSGIGDINTGIGQLNQTMEYVSQSQDLIIKGIDNIILHISDQLYAFWDQLYNLIHVPTMAKLDQILAAIQRMANNSDIHAVVEQIKESTDKQTGEIIANDNANTQKVEQAVEKHGNFIIEGLKSLFIPSDTFFKTWFDEQYQFFHDRLGFLMLPIDILIQFVGIFQAATTGTPGIPFPEFKWIDGTVIIPAQTVGFDFLSTDWGKDIQSKLYFVGNVIMIGALLSLIHKKLEEVLRG